MNKHIGSSVTDWLIEEGLYDDVITGTDPDFVTVREKQVEHQSMFWTLWSIISAYKKTGTLIRITFTTNMIGKKNPQNINIEQVWPKEEIKIVYTTEKP